MKVLMSYNLPTNRLTVYNLHHFKLKLNSELKGNSDVNFPNNRQCLNKLEVSFEWGDGDLHQIRKRL